MVRFESQCFLELADGLVVPAQIEVAHRQVGVDDPGEGIDLLGVLEVVEGRLEPLAAGQEQAVRPDVLGLRERGVAAGVR